MSRRWGVAIGTLQSGRLIGSLRRPPLMLMLLVLLPACAPRVIGAPVQRAQPVSPARAELAALLLNEGRYAEAAREYGYLVSGDGRNHAYRLGLARALAWSGRYADAHAHLGILAARRPGDPAVEELLRTVRANLTPSAAEAARWHAERPGYPPYRLAYARALVREGKARQAVPHFEALLSARPSEPLLRETARAYVSAGDATGARAVLDRHRGRVGTPGVFVEYAHLNVRSGDLDSAEADLRRSLSMGRTKEGYLLMGDIRRWRGDYDGARTWYGWARSVAPRDRDVTAAFAQLIRDERPALIPLVVPGTERGVQVGASALDDNAVTFMRTGLRAGFDVPAGFTASAGAEYRMLRESTASEDLEVSGIAGDVRLGRTLIHGPLMISAGVRAGAVQHDDSGLAPETGAVVRLAYNAWQVGAGLSRGPAYTTLLTVGSLRPERGGDALRETGITVSGGGPIGPADIALTLRRSNLSDGNTRSAIDLALRYNVAPRLSALYTGTSIGYDQRSSLYWDPDGYLANSVGLELAQRQPLGFVYGARALVGVAHTEATPFVRGGVSDDETAARFQVEGGAELGYQQPRWGIGSALRFSRVGEYQRAEATFTLQVQP